MFLEKEIAKMSKLNKFALFKFGLVMLYEEEKKVVPWAFSNTQERTVKRFLMIFILKK